MNRERGKDLFNVKPSTDGLLRTADNGCSLNHASCKGVKSCLTQSRRANLGLDMRAVPVETVKAISRKEVRKRDGKILVVVFLCVLGVL